MQKITESFQNLMTRLQHPVAFEPITNDNDELTQAIENDVHTHENDWQLKEDPDAEELGHFWDEVLADIGSEKQEVEENSVSDKT